MSLQRFKIDVANAVVNADNVSMETMDTGAMLELFTADKGAGAAGGSSGVGGGASGAAAANAAGVGGGGLKTVLTGLAELWDQSQYDEEFNVDAFAKKLGNNGGGKV